MTKTMYKSTPTCPLYIPPTSLTSSSDVSMLCLSLNVTPLEPGVRCHFGLATANRPVSAVCHLGVLAEGWAAVQTTSSDKKGHNSLVVTMLSIWSRQRGTQQYLRKKLKVQADECHPQAYKLFSDGGPCHLDASSSSSSFGFLRQNVSV